MSIDRYTAYSEYILNSRGMIFLSHTEVIDRHFPRSVYFKLPGGVLFEIATDQPGYKSVLDKADLGKKVWLPLSLESRREMIEKRLPEIKV